MKVSKKGPKGWTFTVEGDKGVGASLTLKAEMKQWTEKVVRIVTLNWMFYRDCTNNQYQLLLSELNLGEAEETKFVTWLMDAVNEIVPPK
jgi:hypothetical protein